MTKLIRVLVVAAHPDEAEIYAGGTAANFAEMGHAVKFLSLTNGDAGHFQQGGGVLAARRKLEAEEAGRRLGVSYEILDHHDGELLPSIVLRKQVIRCIRQWQADIVIAFHPESGTHADNKYAGKVVQDAAAFVALTPNVVPQVPALKQSPLFLLMPDYHTRQFYRPDVVIAVDSVVEKKVAACDAHVSQFYEFGPWQQGILDQVPTDNQARQQFILKYWQEFFVVSPEMHESLAKWYGEERAAAVRYAEAFQIADYGPQPSQQEIRSLFPMMAG